MSTDEEGSTDDAASAPSADHSPRLKSRHPQEIDLEDLSMLFKLSLVAAAKKLGISVTTLKKICRNRGIKRWPYRKIRAVDDNIRKFSAARKEMLAVFRRESDPSLVIPPSVLDGSDEPLDAPRELS